jgi:nucleoside-diphosphate-sugar epimerase
VSDATTRHRPGTVLVAGARGVIGEHTARHFAASGWRVVGLARRPALEPVPGVHHRRVDLTDATATRQTIAEAALDISHVVYAAVQEDPGLYGGWSSVEHLERNLSMLRNTIEPLLDLGAPLQHVTLLQGTKAYGVHLGPRPVPSKEHRPRDEHLNFYFAQEDWLRSRRDGAPWAITVLRPQIVFGTALGSAMNPVAAIGAWGSICRELGRPLCFPGGPPHVSEGVDADLVARVARWAATSAAAHDETFNVTNGDVFTWRDVWPTIAAALEVDVGPDEPGSLAALLREHRDTWREIVDRHRLRAPHDIDAFVGQSAIYADGLMAGHRDPRMPVLVSTIKLRQAGFADCCDTEAMMARHLSDLRRRRFLP